MSVAPREAQEGHLACTSIADTRRTRVNHRALGMAGGRNTRRFGDGALTREPLNSG